MTESAPVSSSDEEVEGERRPGSEPEVGSDEGSNPVADRNGDRTPGDEPVPDEPGVDEPVPDEPVPDEPGVDEPVPDEPVAEAARSAVAKARAAASEAARSRSESEDAAAVGTVAGAAPSSDVVPSPEVVPDTAISDGEPPDGEPPDGGGAGSVGRHLPTSVPRQPLRTDERHRRLLLAALVVLALATAALVPLGLNEVWTSTAGHYVGSDMEPGDPNYVALVTPTPTLLVASVYTDPATGEVELTGVALLALHPRNEGGSVLVLPAATVAVGPEAPADEVQEARTLAEAYGTGGVGAVRDGVEEAMVLEVADEVEVNADGWASLAASTGDLEIDTVDPVGDRWPAGGVRLDPEEIGEFLWTATPGESELVRLGRHERFWEGWLTALSDQGPAALPGEADAGLGLFVGGLTAGPPNVVETPMVRADAGGEPSSSADVERLVVDPEAIGGIVAAEVPFPQEPAPGARTRISLLNGTPDEQLGQQAVRPLVEEGAEIAITGNAASFSEPETRLIYTDPEVRTEAHALRNALGVGQVEERAPSGGEGDADPVTDDGERIDVTVILGADAPGAIRRLETTG